MSLKKAALLKLITQKRWVNLKRPFGKIYTIKYGSSEMYARTHTFTPYKT